MSLSLSFGGWSATGILAAVLIVAGIVLLIAYAMRSGLVQRDLPDTEPAPAVPVMGAPAVPAPSAGRTLGAVGAVVLVAGLGLGVVSAMTGWGTDAASGGGPGLAPADCAQSWNGCASTTPAP